jgi:hypothetical protein
LILILRLEEILKIADELPLNQSVN